MQAPTEADPCGFAVAHVLNPYAGASGAAMKVAANAAQMAAAPKMLAALEALVAWTEAIDPDADCDELDAARAAIRQAREA